MIPTRCGLRRLSSFWKACMRTGVSAGPKSAVLRPRKRSGNLAAVRRIHARVTGANTTERSMKFITYSRYTGEDFGIDSQDLLQALSDFLLQSGFQTQYMPFSEWNEHTLEDLKRAIQQALEEGKLFPDEQLEKMMQ